LAQAQPGRLELAAPQQSRSEQGGDGDGPRRGMDGHDGSPTRWCVAAPQTHGASTAFVFHGSGAATDGTGAPITASGWGSTTCSSAAGADADVASVAVVTPIAVEQPFANASAPDAAVAYELPAPEPK